MVFSKVSHARPYVTPFLRTSLFLEHFSPAKIEAFLGSFCRYRKALYFWSLGISLYLELFCFLSFITIVLRNLCSGTHRRNPFLRRCAHCTSRGISRTGTFPLVRQRYASPLSQVNYGHLRRRFHLVFKFKLENHPITESIHLRT